MEPKIKINDYGCLTAEAGAGFLFFKKDYTFLFCSSSRGKPIERWRHKTTGLLTDSRATKGGKKMFKKSVVLVIVMVMLVSFSAAVIADDGEGKAPKNEADVEVQVENEDGEKEIRFMDAVDENAKENGNEERPTNPITVAGK